MRERLERRPRRDIDVIASGSDEMALVRWRCLAERGGSEWASCPVTAFTTFLMQMTLGCRSLRCVSSQRNGLGRGRSSLPSSPAVAR